MRHMIRHVIKLGHHGEFMEDVAAWNVEARSRQMVEDVLAGLRAQHPPA